MTSRALWLSDVSNPIMTSKETEDHLQTGTSKGFKSLYRVWRAGMIHVQVS